MRDERLMKMAPDRPDRRARPVHRYHKQDESFERPQLGHRELCGERPEGGGAEEDCCRERGTVVGT